jgi:methylenetetrahydrofolate reductase (NADPH)
MLFSTEDYLRLRDRMAAAGANVPVLPGIMPITSYGRLMRIHELSGQRIPPQLAAELEAVEGDADAGRAVGMDHAVRMSVELLAEGAPCLHFYTFNRSKATIEVLTALGMAPVLRR